MWGPRLLWASLATAPLFAGWIVFAYRDQEYALGLAGFGAIAALFLAPAAAGLLQEFLLFGNRPRTRVVAALTLAVVVGAVFTTGDLRSVLLSAGVLLVLIPIGWTALRSRWIDARRLKPYLEPLRGRDAGTYVERYGEPDDTTGEFTVELLPGTPLVHHPQDPPDAEWVEAERVTVAAPPAAWPHQLAPPRESVAPPDAIAAHTRPMTPDEHAELRHFRRRQLRHVVVSILPSIYMTGWVVRAGEQLVRGDFAPEISGLGWILSIVFGLVYPAIRLLGVFAIDRDLANRTIVGQWVGSPEARAGGPVTEHLASSGLLWSSGGRPAGWRLTMRS